MSEKPSYRELEQKIKKMKLMENELLVTRHLFEDIVQSLPDPTFVIDKNKTIIAWNRAIEEMTGLSGKDMIGKSNYAYSVPFWGKPRPVLIDIIIDPDLENLKLYDPVKKSGDSLITETFLPDFGEKGGTYVWLKASPIYDHHGNIIGAIEAIRDITEKKQAENDLKKERETLFNILESNPHGIALIDNKDRYTYINPEFTNITGYTLKDIPTKQEWFKKAYPDENYRKQILITWKNDKKQTDVNKTRGTNREFRIQCKNKEIKYIEFRSTFLKNKTISVLTDVTESRITQKALMENEEKLKAIFQANPDPLVVYDVNGYPLYMNSAFSKVFGWTLNELRGKRIPFVPEDQIKITKLKIKEIYEFGNPVSFETTRLSKDGKIIDVLLSASIIKNIQGIHNGLVVNLKDNTERKKLEAQLQQAQKMEAIGTLAGGIAHDFNNILFPVLGHTEILMHEIPENSPVHDRLKKIYNGAIRARDLVKQILTFSRQDSFELKSIRLQPVIKEAVTFIRSTIPATIDITYDISDKCGNIKADPTQIYQIIINLSTNAYHAMEEKGGELKIKLEQVKSDQAGMPVRPGSYACLTVSDTGTGMDKEVAGKIFDPFFTTKEKGKGTGMGLSVVHGIVESMNGFIHVDTEPGSGTEFKLYFPVEKHRANKNEIKSEISATANIKTIMLIDDEEPVVSVEKHMLEILGYNVASFTSSVKAIQIFEENPHQFDMVITDMAMPKISGAELSGRIIKIRPDIPILMCTGFSEKMSEEKAFAIGIKGLLIKPVEIIELAQKINEISNTDNNNHLKEI